MNSTALLERTREWAARLEEREANRGADDIRKARERVARKAGVAPGLLENLRRGRLKFWRPVMDGIRAAFIAELQGEIARLRHDLQVAHQCGADPHSDEIMEAVTLIERARKLVAQASGEMK